MAIGFHGQTWIPATDNATTPLGSSTPHAITPPASMTAGMLVLVVVAVRNNTDPAVSNNGGQTWQSETLNTNGAAVGCKLFSCYYDGTWDANPSFTTGSTTDGVCLWMGVFTGVDQTTRFDVNPAAFDLAAATASTLTGFSTNTNGAWAMFVWCESDDNVLSGQDAGWTGPNGSTGSLNDHVGNQGGLDIGLFLSKKTQSPAGATGDNVVAKNSGDLGAGYYFAIKPAAIEASQPETNAITDDFSAGLLHSVASAETNSITDEFTSAASIPGDQAETNAITDDFSAAVLVTAGQAETNPITDDFTAINTAVAEQAETNAITDEFDATTGSVVPATQEETNAVVDEFTNTATIVADQPETNAVDDAFTVIATLLSANDETNAIADAPDATVLLPVAQSDSNDIADDFDALIVLPVVSDESASVTDSFDAVVLYQVGVTESAAASDTHTGTATFPVDQSESNAVTDEFTAGLTYSAAQEETNPVTDEFDASILVFVDATQEESAGITDDFSATAIYVVDIQEVMAGTAGESRPAYARIVSSRVGGRRSFINPP